MLTEKVVTKNAKVHANQPYLIKQLNQIETFLNSDDIMTQSKGRK